jgi:hypothetical protein
MIKRVREHPILPKPELNTLRPGTIFRSYGTSCYYRKFNGVKIDGIDKIDIAAKRRPGEIDSVFHWAGKIHKKNNKHIGISNSYGIKNMNTNLFVRY